MKKSYIKLDGRWYHVEVVEVYHQQSLFGEDVKMVRFRRNKKSAELEEAERSRFVDKKPRQYKPKEYQA